MPADTPSARARVSEFFALDAEWGPGNPPVARRDVLTGVVVIIAERIDRRALRQRRAG